MMARALVFALLAGVSLAAVPVEKPKLAAPMPVKLTVEQQKLAHSGCVSACSPSPVESKCVTACEVTMMKCIDETGPNETPKDTKSCEDKTLKLYTETKGVEKKAEKKADAKKEGKKEEKKAEKKKSFLQIRNIDDDNAEAAEMARLEAQSDKDMGEDDDESSKTDAGDDEARSDEEAGSDEAGEEEASSDEEASSEDAAGSDEEASSDEEAYEGPAVGDVAEKEFEKKEDEKKALLQTGNIDDDNAEAAEMARLEAQSDKDMGEDDDESSKTDDSDNDASSDDQE
jgi:hypothetical protein